MKFKIIMCSIVLLLGTINIIGQTTPTKTVNTVQPKIMVIPFTKEGEDIRTILEQDPNLRIAITKVKEGFDNKGFTTVDFIGKLKSAKDNNLFTSDNQSDLKSQLISMSGADIYVVAEVITHQSTDGNSVKIILTGYAASTGNSLANKVFDSGLWNIDDWGVLSAKAVSKGIEEFLNVMQTKFDDIVENGQSINIDFSFAQGSQYNMSSDNIGTSGLPLSDQIEQWMKDNAYKNNYHIQGTTDTKMIFDDVRIPLKDANGNNYNPNNFALEIYKFLKGIGLQPAKSIKNGTIYITIK